MLALAALLFLPCAAQTQAETGHWPPRTVRIVVPFAPGSTPDMVGRVLADSLQARHPGTSFIVENKPGASGNIGTDAVAKAAPDGATVGISLADRSLSTRCCSQSCLIIPTPISHR